MHRPFQDQMAIVRRLGKSVLFITFTCNPNWPEITQASGDRSKDRPDIVSRVLKIKLKAFLAEIVKDGIFGKCFAHVYVIEFQKKRITSCPYPNLAVALMQNAKG